MFNLEVTHSADNAKPVYEKPLRYGKLDEIHHIFREDPKSPPQVVSVVFALAVVATLPIILYGVCVLFPVSLPFALPVFRSVTCERS